MSATLIQEIEQAQIKSDLPEMPWTRGRRRAAFIAKRSGAPLKKAA